MWRKADSIAVAQLWSASRGSHHCFGGGTLLSRCSTSTGASRNKNKDTCIYVRCVQKIISVCLCLVMFGLIAGGHG